MNKKIGELETVPGYGRQPMETKHMLLSPEHYRRLLQGEEAGGDL